MNWAYFSLVLSRVKIFAPSSGQIMQDKFWHSPLHRHIYGYSLPLSHLSFFVVTPSGGRFRQVNTTSADNSDWSVQTFVISSWWCDFPALWYESFMASLEQLAPPVRREQSGYNLAWATYLSIMMSFRRRRGRRRFSLWERLALSAPTDHYQTIYWVLCHLIGCWIFFLLEFE